jgi:hypothetical protein
MKKNYLSTSQNKTLKKDEKIDLREEFQEMLKETKISDEEVQKIKLNEETKITESINQAKKDFDEKTEKLKNEFESNTKNTENEKSENKKKSTSNFGKGKEEESKNKNTEATPGAFSKFMTGFKKVWKQTFPGEDNLELLIEKRKAEAQFLKSKIKEATEEEIAEIEAKIPEWKRGAVVLVADQPPEEGHSLFESAKRNLTNHVKNLKIYQDTQKNLENSELSLLVNDLKTSYTNVKDNLKESQNPFFVVSRDLVDRVSFKSPSSQAIVVMRKHDPNFELIDFEKEVNVIFKQLMTAFLKDDLDTIKLIASEMALAVLTNEIKTRKERVNLYF